MHVSTKELPEVIRRALREVNYSRNDIGVEGATKVSPSDAGGQGRRGFVLLLDLDTGATKLHQGSWGGANMFNQSNVVDLDQKSYPLPPSGAVIKGSEGGHGGVIATLYLNPENLAKLLPAKPLELTAKQRGILYAFGAIKAGEYRKEELRRCEAKEADVEELVKLKLLKRDGRGVTITTEGKNTRNSGPGSGNW